MSSNRFNLFDHVDQVDQVDQFSPIVQTDITLHLIVNGKDDKKEESNEKVII